MGVLSRHQQRTFSMKTRNKLIVTTAALALAIGVGTYAFKASSQERGPGFGPRFMHGVGHGMGHGMMGAGSNSAATGEMDVIHELIVNHDRISRTVTNLPDGIRTVTESDDPRIARFIKEHVASMGQRVSAGNDPGLPIESPALHAIFRNKDKISTTVETTDKGIIVVQTSNDHETVAALQQHASEVSDLVRGGMLAARTAMMRNGVMHDEDVHLRMHGGMMRDIPNRSAAPDAQ
jgi:hypothetical protein